MLLRLISGRTTCALYLCTVNNSVWFSAACLAPVVLNSSAVSFVLSLGRQQMEPLEIYIASMTDQNSGVEAHNIPLSLLIFAAHRCLWMCPVSVLCSDAAALVTVCAHREGLLWTGAEP